MMRLGTPKTPCLAIVGTTALAVLGSALAVVSSWQIGDLFKIVTDEHVPSLRAVHNLEISLLEQRGFVSSYLLDGGTPGWLKELEGRKGDFQRWLARADEEAQTPEERELLQQLTETFRQYREKRDEVVALYDSGLVERAKHVFLRDVNRLYDRCYQLSENVVAANQSAIDSSARRAQTRVSWIIRMVIAGAGLTVGLSVVLLWTFGRGVRSEKQRTKYRAQLLAAQRIQRILVPQDTPQLPGLDVASVWHPAEMAGGDYVDYLPMSDGSLGLVVGDVSGHSVGSALLMAATRAYLRVLVKVRSDIDEILSLANSMLADDFREGHFVTLILAQVDPQTKVLRYANAGHPPGYVLAASGEVKADLESTALPLGVLAETDFPEGGAIALVAGDIVVLFTDGVLEARSADERPFGQESALEVIRSHRSAHAQEITESLYQAVREHARPGELADDVAVTVMKVKPGDPAAPNAN